MTGSLRGRLARALGVTAAVSVAATALIAFGLVRRYAGDAAVAELLDRGRAVAREAQALELREAPLLRRLLQTSGDQIALVTPRGFVQSEDPAARRVAAAIDLPRVLAGAELTGTIRTADGSFAYAAVPIRGTRIRNSAVVLARPVALARDIWGPVAVRVLLAGAIAVALAVAVSAALARSTVKPLRAMSEATARIAGGDLSSRVPVDGHDEVAELAQRFNGMASSLSEARRREHEFLASVSHELRTPITSIRGYAEALADGTVAEAGAGEALGVIRGETERLERLVQDVMDLARLGAREFRLEIGETDLAEKLAEAARAHATAAAVSGVALEVEAVTPLLVTTDAARVRQILGNLVENALRVTPSGGRIALAGRREDESVVVEVSDTGPGIAPADVPHVFERSYLWARSRGVREVGSGLGLAIVRELAEALGGSIAVTSDPGRGTTFSLRLPLARAVQ